MHRTETSRVRKVRDRWNTLILVLPGQWLPLMAVYWVRSLPPLRPYGYEPPASPGLTALIGVALGCVPLLLPRNYFLPRSFERGNFYPRMGIRWFRYFAPDGDLVNRWVRRADPSYRVIHDRQSLRQHILGTFPNERCHLGFFLAGLWTQALAVLESSWALAALLTLTNTVFNLYPVMHQRHKRARVRGLWDMLDAT